MSAGTSIANVTDVALKKLRGGWGNGGSAGYRKTERSDRQSNNKLKGMRQRGLRHPLWCFRLQSFPILHLNSLKLLLTTLPGQDPPDRPGLVLLKWPIIGSLHRVDSR